MRHIAQLVPSVAVVGTILLCGPSLAAAQERASLAGYGGLSLNSMTSDSFTPSVGGTLTFNMVEPGSLAGAITSAGTLVINGPNGLSTSVDHPAFTGLVLIQGGQFSPQSTFPAAIQSVQTGGKSCRTLNREMASQPTSKAETIRSNATFEPAIASARVWP